MEIFTSTVGRMGSQSSKQQQPVQEEKVFPDPIQMFEGEKPVTSRYSRVQCYKARDTYFTCLEDNDENSWKCLQEMEDVCIYYFNCFLPLFILSFSHTKTTLSFIIT